ncbi:cytochrome P450 [Xylariomycetidae sp. FL2044]|nr:cytochrome P450 [Xylariomycetidae sp. FL2044]
MDNSTNKRTYGDAILEAVQTPKLGLAVGLVVLTCVLYAIAPGNKALDRYPGPWIARWTNIWRLYIVYARRYAPTVKKLHEKYGPIVRLGPNILDLDYPELGKVIYNTDGQWNKSDFYKNNSAMVDGKIQYHLFSQVESAEHARLKRPIVRHYSVPSVLALEKHMDKVIDDLSSHLENRFINQGKDCDLGAWLGYYAWDFISAVTFSKRFGYMVEGCDFDGTHNIANKSIDYLGICGQMPFLDFWLDKNPVIRLGPPNLDTVARMAVEALVPRLKGEDTNFDPQNPDFLQYFIDSKTTYPEVVDDMTIINYLLLNLIAGADTTAITMRALFFHCLKNRAIWDRLTREVRAAGIGTERPASYQAARAIPYVEAVVRETLRYHPAVSMCMERVVPHYGLDLPDGSSVPPGTLVGVNPYIIGRNRGVFGADADAFRPERWLRGDEETEEAYRDRMVRWNAASMTFGGGSRICLGRHLSQMEVYKIVATLAACYDLELVDPDARLKTVSRWFYRIENDCIICRLKKVEGSG